MPRLVFALLLVAAALPLASADAHPLILLPAPHLRPGSSAQLEVVAPAAASSCSLTLDAARRSASGRYAVGLGGPTRFVRWRVPTGARGTWGARFSCVAASRGKTRSLGAFAARLVVGGPGRRRGRIVTPGSLRIGPGSIPELPSTAARAAAVRSLPAPVSNNDVNVNAPTFPFTPCADSAFVTSTRTIGEGLATVIQMVPTRAARENAAFGLAGIGDTRRSDNPVFQAMWGELNRCANFSQDLTTSERHSLYEQMACHARYGVTTTFGGNTWDFEAWRKDVDWTIALSVGGSCGQRYGDVPNAGAYLHGRIVNAFPDPNPAQRAAWLVDTVNGREVRRHITTTRAYDCLVAAGKPPAHWFSAEFLGDYLPISAPDITDEICSSSPPSDPAPAAPSGPQQPGPQPPASAPVSPSRVNAYDNYGEPAVGHAMCRGNPGNGLSMPGGTAAETFAVPSGVASVDTALVQIDRDSQVNAHATLSVNGTARATADAAAADDTTFHFPSVSVQAGDQLSLSISFSATYGKLITVYTAGSPGGTFTASNSCPDGAPSFTASPSGLRAVISGWSR